MARVEIKLQNGASVPKYQTSGAAGFDLCATEDCTLGANEVKLVSTGLSVAVPEGYELQVRSRSGLAVKSKLVVLNSPGTVDSDYRGEVKVILANLGSTPFNVLRGDRIAQGVIAPVVKADFVVVDELSATQRGSGGFGSTGV